MILEFKVQDAEDEKELSDTVKEALKQIEKKNMNINELARSLYCGIKHGYPCLFVLCLLY